MNKIAVILYVMIAIGFTACASTPKDHYYDRATNSSNEAIQSLDNE
ncbi:MAG: hypothetical protein PHU40_08790 [Sulfurimonas sp.]|jgi:uncharacterized lipoprotein YmbA|nr:hypothetical protein [Sulfurimonas sp.]